MSTPTCRADAIAAGGTDLLVVLNHVFVVRNFLLSGVLERLVSTGLRVAVLVPKAYLRVVSERVPGLARIEELERVQASRWRRSSLEWLRLGSFLARRRFPEYERKVTWNADASFGRRVALAIWRFVSRFGDTEKAAGAVVRRLTPNASARQFVSDVSPRLVLWATTVTTTHDFDVIKAAADRGTPILFSEGSWDNLVTKGAIWPRPDRLLVWGEFSRHYARDPHGFAANRIEVTGPPHFDVYARPERLTPRARWFEQHGLDARRRLIMIGGSTIGAAMEPGALRMMSSWIDDGHLPKSYLWYRPHPKAINRKRVPLAEILAIPHVIVDKGVTHAPPEGDWVIQSDEASQRANVLAASDVVVSMFSTVVIEGALLGKPALLIEFARAGDITRRANRRYRDFGHVQYLSRCPWIRHPDTPEQFREQLAQFLREPAETMSGDLRAFAETIARCLDGLAGRRIVDAVQESLNEARGSAAATHTIEGRVVGI